MSDVSSKINCVKCVKGGTGIVTCEGCHQTFCNTHLFEHRQEIVEQAEQMKMKCQQFRDDIGKDADPTPILVEINRWEDDSIKKIRSVADAARRDVEQTTQRMKHNFTQIITKISEKVNATQKTDDVTERDFNRWNEELLTLKKLIRKPFPVVIADDDQPSAAIRLIKVKYRSPFIDMADTNAQSVQKPAKKGPKLPPVSIPGGSEKFSHAAGHATISDDHSVATFVGYSSVVGVRTYSTGVHRLKIDMIDKKHEGIFFGILTASTDIIPRASELSSVYGWRDFDRSVTNGNAQLRAFKDKNIKPGDQFILIIDCEKCKLVLLHHQLRKKVQMLVDLDECPFPWKLIVSSFGEDVVSVA